MFYSLLIQILSQINAPTEHFAHTSFLQMELMQNLADIIMGSVQYNEEGVLMSIKELCGVMTETSHNATQEAEMEAYHRLVKLSQVQMAF